MIRTFQNNWRMYLYEMFGLGWVMLIAGVVASLLWFPGSPLGAWINSEWLKRSLMGAAMAGGVVSFIYSPWGKSSGAHINPVITLTFLGLGKVKPWDAAFYVVAQFIGGTLGVLLFTLIMGDWAAHPRVNYIVTFPGQWGAALAFTAELLITFAIIMMVLFATNREGLAKYTGIFAGTMLATFIIFESPISGTSMNPARSFGSAAVANHWTHLWIYFVAPSLGAAAAVVYYLIRGRRQVKCAKLHHQNDKPCIFRCGYADGAASTS